MSSEEQLDGQGSAAGDAPRPPRRRRRRRRRRHPSDDGYSADALRFKFDDSALRVTDAYGEELEAPTAAMAVAFDASLRLDAGPASSSNVALVHALVDVLRRYPRVVLEAHVPPSLALAAAKPKALAHHLGVGPAAPVDETAVRLASLRTETVVSSLRALGVPAAQLLEGRVTLEAAQQAATDAKPLDHFTSSPPPPPPARGPRAARSAPPPLKRTRRCSKAARLAAEQQRAHRRLAQLERATEEFRRVEAYAVQQVVRHEPTRPIQLEPHVVLEVRVLDWRYDGRTESGGEGSSSAGGGAEGGAHSLYAVHGVDRHPCGPADDWRVSIDVGSEAVEELGIELWGSALLGAADVHVLKLLRGEQTTASLVGEHEVALVELGAGGGEVGAVQLQIEAHLSHKYRDALTHETPAPGLVAHTGVACRARMAPSLGGRPGDERVKVWSVATKRPRPAKGTRTAPVGGDARQPAHPARLGHRPRALRRHPPEHLPAARRPRCRDAPGAARQPARALRATTTTSSSST